jgi:NADH-quinone oxidoreductase subunit E
LLEANKLSDDSAAPQTGGLSDASKAQIDAWLQKYPADQRRSAVIAALHIVQKENGGSLTEDLMNQVGAYLGLPPIAVYEVATFYGMYDLNPVGRHKVNVCGNISCHLRGARQMIAHLEDRLGIKLGETTADGKFTLREVECLAACRNAPVMQLDEDYVENLTPERINEILDEIK